MCIPVLPILPDFSPMIGFCHQHGNRKRESPRPACLIQDENCQGLTNLPHHRRFVDQALPMVALTLRLRLVTNAWRRVIIILRAPSGYVSAHPLGPGRRPQTPEPAACVATGACRMTIGRVNPAFRLDDQGITGLGAVHYNLIEPALLDAAVQRGEGRMGLGGAFLVSTGTHTGRSPKDKHVVRTASVENTIWWENNAAQSPEGVRAALCRHAGPHAGPRLFRAGSLCRRRPVASSGRAGGDGTGLARPLHPPPAAPPGPGRA